MVTTVPKSAIACSGVVTPLARLSKTTWKRAPRSGTVTVNPLVVSVAVEVAVAVVDVADGMLRVGAV